MLDWLDEVTAERIVLDVVLKDYLQLPGVEIRNKGFAVVHFVAEESFRDVIKELVNGVLHCEAGVKINYKRNLSKRIRNLLSH